MAGTGTFYRPPQPQQRRGGAPLLPQQLTRTASDSLTTADTDSRQVTLLRTVSDSLAITDAVTGIRSVQRTTADTIHFSEAQPHLANDSITFSDVATRLVTLARAPSDSLTVSDAVTGLRALFRSTANSVTLASAGTRSVTLLRSAWDGSRDTFTRSVSNDWGTANAGGVWTWLTLPSTYASVNGSAGLIVASDTTTVRLAYLQAIALDQDVRVKWSADKAVSGATQQPRVLPRFVDTDNYYRLRVDVQTSTQVRLVWEINEAGTVSTLTTSADLFAFTFGQELWIRARALGADDADLAGKVWIVGTPEPDWQLTWTDAAQGLQGPGSIGLQFRAGTGTNNLPVTASFDELSAGLLIEDAATRAGGSLRTTADSLTAADAAVQLKSINKTGTDALTLSDAVTRVQVLARAVAEALTVADQSLRTLALARSITDALTTGDAVIRVAAYARTPADSLTISETPTRVLGLARAISQSLTIADVAIRGIGVVRTTGNSLTITDAAGRVLVAVRSTADSLTISALTASGSTLQTMGAPWPQGYSSAQVPSGVRELSVPRGDAKVEVPEGR